MMSIGTAAPVSPAPEHGLSAGEAARRLAASSAVPEPTSRSYASIVRGNTLTVFNAILLIFGVLTLTFGNWRDALFLGILVSNAGIGILQEVRAKRTLDRLAALVAPTARVVRDGIEQTLAISKVVEGDVLRIGAGDQVPADGRLIDAQDLAIDESILTGETHATLRAVGDEVRSGSFAAEGLGTYVVTAIGQSSYAQRLLGETRGFRHERSPLERAMNRLLLILVGAMVPLGSLLGYVLWTRKQGLTESISTATAGVVTLVPEGLILLSSVTYAVASLRIARAGALAQQLSAIESLASVDVICVDKTGTLTEADLRVVEHQPVAGGDPSLLAAALSQFAAAWDTKNGTLRAIGLAFPDGPVDTVGARVPFSSRTRWSGVEVGAQRLVLCAPELLDDGALADVVSARTAEGRRVLALAKSAGPLVPGDRPPAGLEPLGIVVLGERLRPEVRETIAYLDRENVRVVVLSGDAPQTVGAIARDVGIPISGAAIDGTQLPEAPEELSELVLRARVVGRISPEGKRRVVEALQKGGANVAMLGDGVNDVPALRAANLGIAQGSGSQMARAVADLVLVSGSFASVPAMVSEGRRILRNLQRVAKLFVTKSVFAAFLILTVGLVQTSYPFLPRHLTLAVSLTIGIPGFFLALARSEGTWTTDGFLRGISHFSVPAGVAAGLGVVSAYLFALNTLRIPLIEARTVAVTVLIGFSLSLIVILESAARRARWWVWALCGAMASAYVVALVTPSLRSFYAIAVPSPTGLVTAVGGITLALGGLWLVDERFAVWHRASKTLDPQA